MSFSTLDHFVFFGQRTVQRVCYAVQEFCQNVLLQFSMLYFLQTLHAKGTRVYVHNATMPTLAIQVHSPMYFA